MKKAFIFLFLLLNIVTGCKKSADKVESEMPCLPYLVPEFKIKEILTFRNNKYYKSEYYYDTTGRVYHRRDSSESINEIFWEYIGGRVYLRTNDSIVFETLFLNGQGYAANNNGSIGLTAKSWKYDSLGFMIEEGLSAPQAGTTVYSYYYSCLNNVSINKSWSWFGAPPTSEPEIVTTVEYYPDKRNTIGNENQGIFYFGKQNNCLVKWVIAYKEAIADTEGVYFYEYDSLSRVKTETIKKAGDVKQIRTFTYHASY